MVTIFQSVCFALLFCTSCVCLWYMNRYRYWKRKKVKGPNPTLIFGNMLELFTKKYSLGTQFQKLYERTKHLPYAGIYIFHRPALIVNNLDLMSFIMVNDFDHFTDRGLVFDEKTEPLIQHLHNLNGDRWRKLSNKITPAFSSNKIKETFDSIFDCGIKMTEYLKNAALIESMIDVKEVMAKFTTDTIISFAFGIESNSFENPNVGFKKMDRDVFEFGLKRKLIMFISLFTFDVRKILNAKIFKDDVKNYFMELINDVLNYRKENNVSKDDIMDTLIRLKDTNNQYTKLTQIELTAIAFGFFLGGLETATSSTFLFYELAKNQDIQTKLREEIESVLQKHDGKITYESLNEMTYMMQVIEETLRKYPPIPQQFRICTKDYIIPYTKTLIEKGSPVYMSALGVQKDPEIYPDPETFDPERFSMINKAKLHNLSFLSFGEGPRMCIGNKLAVMVMRIAIVSIILNYNIQFTEKDLKNDALLSMPKELKLKISFISTL